VESHVFFWKALTMVATSVSDTDSMQLVTGSSSGAQYRSSSVPLLDRLRSPGPSELSRKRKVRKNMPPLGKRRSKGGRKSTGPKSVTPSQRVGEFQGEMLTVSDGRLLPARKYKWSIIVIV